MRQCLIDLSTNDILLVKGPAVLRRCEGNVMVLGKEIKGEVTVRAAKILPFETKGSSKVQVRTYGNGTCRIARGHFTAGVSIWKDVADRMREKPKRIMLVGATDTGKSTLTTYLCNIANANSLKVGVTDGDVGQADLAPPGCIGAAMIGKQFLDLREVNAEYFSFIGSISPMGMEDLVIDNIKKILDKLSTGTDICVINTDGYVDEHGIDYKIALAKTIKPDLIVYIGDVLKKFDEFEVVRVSAPTSITKTRADREQRRLQQYARFLGGRRHIFELREKNFAFKGKVYEYGILNGDLIRIQNTLLPLDVLKGMFVGLGMGCDARGFGIITRIASGKILVETPYEDEFDTIILSNIAVSLAPPRERILFRIQDLA